MGGLKEKYSKICVECKKPFMSKHRDTQYCSKSCKDKAWRNCNPRYNYEWFLRHLDAKMRKKEKARSSEGREYQRNYMKQWYPNHTESYRQYKQLNRQKVNAEAFARRHSSLSSQCELCGSTENLERHHPDYSEPTITVTVCRLCHTFIHRGEQICLQ
jgi:hypothetical protein